MAPPSQESAPYLLLGFKESAARKKRLLGCVVSPSNMYAPYDHYRPNLDDTTVPELDQLKQVMQSLWIPGEEVNVSEIIAGKAGSSSKDAGAKLTEFLQLYGNRKTKKAVTFKAASGVQYTLDNAGSKLQDSLWKNSGWSSELRKLVEQDRGKHKHFLLVTGVYTCKDIEFTWSKGADSAGGGEIRVPVGQAAGLPDQKILDVQAQVEAEKAAEEEESLKIEEEVVIGVKYNILDIHWKDNSDQAGGGVASKLLKWAHLKKSQRYIEGVALGDVVRGFGFNPYAGSSDDEAGSGQAGQGIGGTHLEFYYHEPPYKLASELEAPQGELNGSAGSMPPSSPRKSSSTRL